MFRENKKTNIASAIRKIHYAIILISIYVIIISYHFLPQNINDSDDYAIELVDDVNNDKLPNLIQYNDENIKTYDSNDESIDVDSDENHSSVEETPKPILVLHVGIMKTASTYIQLDLLRKKRWNRVYKKLLLDDYEVITEEYKPNTFEMVIKHCLLLNEKKCDHKLWGNLVHLYAAAREWNGKRHLLQSLESFSIIPKPFNDWTKTLLRSLSDNYDVRIVVFYRRLHEWIISLYTQYRKQYIYRARDRDNPWIQHYNNIDEIKTLPEWLEDLLKTNSSFHYTTTTTEEFENIFGKEKVTVLDYHAHDRGGIETEFICRGIPNATHACEEAKLIVKEHKENPEKVVKVNSGHQYLLDHDLLIVEAFRQNLLTGPRHNATIVLDKKLKDMNMTISQLPKTCLSTERLKWLRNLADSSEMKYSSLPMSREELNDYAERYETKIMCSIDAPRVLQNNTWRKIFSSCEFQSDRCREED